MIGLLFALMLGGWDVSVDIPVSQAVQKQEDTKQELPMGRVDEIKVYRVDAEAAEHVPSYENQLSFFNGEKTYYYVDATWDDKGEYNEP